MDEPPLQDPVDTDHRAVPQGRATFPLLPALALALVVLVAIGVWRSLGAETAATPPEAPVQPVDASRQRPATLESGWPMATARAEQWDPEARLLSVSAQYDWPTDPGANQRDPAGGWLIYVFVRGHGDQTESLAIMVERNGAIIARETASVLGTDAPGIDPAAFVQAAIDSTEALALATDAGGGAFRSECRARRHVTRLSFRPSIGGSRAVWVVSYGDSGVRNGPALTVSVDATTGEAEVSPFAGTDPPLDGLEPCPE